jgi:hypothetical protein
LFQQRPGYAPNTDSQKTAHHWPTWGAFGNIANGGGGLKTTPTFLPRKKQWNVALFCLEWRSGSRQRTSIRSIAQHIHLTTQFSRPASVQRQAGQTVQPDERIARDYGSLIFVDYYH